MALTQKEISHNCYIRRKENGLCPRCGKPLDRTGYYCSDCLKKNNEREKEFREWCKEYKICPQYRIRKLTPRECGRLMGVSDEDIDKMAAVNSNTQLYKQFGNSIVVDIMCAMFENLNINQGGTV
jgi:site-specific DNA-cytosine methylase